MSPLLWVVGERGLHWEARRTPRLCVRNASIHNPCEGIAGRAASLCVASPERGRCAGPARYGKRIARESRSGSVASRRESAPHPCRGCKGGASRYEAGIPVRLGFPLRFRRRSASGKGRAIPCIKFPILSLIGIVWPGRKTFREISRLLPPLLSSGFKEQRGSIRETVGAVQSQRVQPGARLFVSPTDRRTDFRSVHTIH
jgi:hypothetical protein